MDRMMDVIFTVLWLVVVVIYTTTIIDRVNSRESLGGAPVILIGALGLLVMHIVKLFVGF